MIEESKKALAELAGKNRYEVMIETTSILTALMEREGIVPIVVGGLAVEVYTRGQYTTLDIDLVMMRRDYADKVLKDLGFNKEGRHWYHAELEVAIEIPGNMLEDADHERVIKINLPSGRHIYVIGLEDIILDRLRACVHWESTSDCEWGLRMLKVHKHALDKAYMQMMAAKDHSKSADKLKEWLGEAK